MAIKGQLKDALGNVLHSETASDVVLRSNGNSVETDLAAAEGKITAAEGKIAANEGSIAALQTSVGALESSVGENAGAITELQGSVATNAGDISTLQGSVATNAQGIESLTTEVNALKGAVGGSARKFIVETISERDALTELRVGDKAYVKDATGDATVTRGGAEYLWDGIIWIKTSEAESLDVIVTWDDVQDKKVDVAVVENGQTPTDLAVTGLYFEKAAVAAG